MHVLHGVVCHVWLYVCNAYYVFAHMVEEKALGFCRVWKPICEIRIKAEAKD